MLRDPTTFPTEKSHFYLTGPAGILEIKTQMPALAVIPENLQVGVVCHPHPLYQGSMDHKIVSTALRALEHSSAASLCFNYRGVGASTGTYGDSIGEVEDLLCVLDWLHRCLPKASVVLIGFSFGAFIALRGAVERPDQVVRLISLAPAVHHQPYETWSHQVSCPWQVIMGTADEIVPVEEVIAWYQKIQDRASLILWPKTSHFFHGKLVWLRQTIEHFLSQS